MTELDPVSSDVRQRRSNVVQGVIFIAGSQCSSAFPSTNLHMSNQVVVYVFEGSFGSLSSRGMTTVTRSPSARTATTFVVSLSHVGVLGRVPKNFTTPSRPEATFGLCCTYRAVSHLLASSQ